MKCKPHLVAMSLGKVGRCRIRSRAVIRKMNIPGLLLRIIAN
jgi:hypothetical protein